MDPTDNQCAELAQQFLSRVQLTGQEVPAYNHVMAWLGGFPEIEEPPSVG